MDRRVFDMSDFLRHSGATLTDCHDDNQVGGNTQCAAPLTMAFVNIQPLESVYSLNDAFCNGTLFPNLNKPFMGGTVR